MKLAIQENLFPSKSFSEFLEKARAWGFDAVEVWGEGLEKRLEEVVYSLKSSGILACSICPGGSGICGSLIHDAPAMRAAARNDISMYLEFGARLGGAGLILVPEFGENKFMRLSPDLNFFDKKKEMFLEEFAPLAARAKELGVPIFIEPLNRYEAYFLILVEQAFALCRALDNPYVSVLADLFHMNIEERDMPAALERAAPHLGHVHLVDSNRRLPGEGHIDFSKITAVLKSIGYKGFLCLECCIAGEPDILIPASMRGVHGFIGS